MGTAHPVHQPPVPDAASPVWPGLPSGRFMPMTPDELARMHQGVLDIMEQVGFGDPTPRLIEVVGSRGGWVDEHGRLRFPRTLVEDVIANAPHTLVLPGRDPRHDFEVGEGRLHTGTGGASPNIVDFATGGYRPASVADLYDVARLVDRMENIHFFWRPIAAADIAEASVLDINTAYACLQGTTKHFTASFVNGDSVRAAVRMFDMVLGGEGRFRERPFCSASCCHVIPPLRFAADSCDALEAAVMAGMPVGVVSAGQAGSTSPVTLAAMIAQTAAECLAGLVFAYLLDPNCRVHLSAFPFVSDLRTGASSAGAAEQGLLASGFAQLTHFWRLPASIAAGMTDSKAPDVQAGAEKALSLALTANAGASMILEAAGMQASLMGVSLEAFVLDNEMLAAVQRTVRGIEVNEDTLSVEAIRGAVLEDGHYLSRPETRARMRRDFVYPKVGNRDTPSAWEEGGRVDVRERARARVRAILAEHYPGNVDPAVDEKIRALWDIHLPREFMAPGSGRW